MPATYNALLHLIAFESEILDPHELEALAEEAFDALAPDLTDGPDYCSPYGVSFGLVDMSKTVTA